LKNSQPSFFVYLLLVDPSTLFWSFRAHNNSLSQPFKC